jgi:polyisoprenoid-binding protein YceI
VAKTHLTIDAERSRIEFSIRYYTFSRVKGTFAKWSGRIDLDDDMTRSSVEVEIDPTSVRTGIEKRDLAVANDFFGAREHPRVTFKSRSVERAGDDAWRLTGDLAMRGATHPVTLDVQRAGREGAFRAKTEIARKQWGVACRAQGDLSPLLIGSIVTVEVSVEAAASSGG